MSAFDPFLPLELRQLCAQFGRSARRIAISIADVRNSRGRNDISRSGLGAFMTPEMPIEGIERKERRGNSNTGTSGNHDARHDQGVSGGHSLRSAFSSAALP
jgi:hypothetical protein